MRRWSFEPEGTSGPPRAYKEIRTCSRVPNRVSLLSANTELGHAQYRGQIRIIDESEEEYLYPERRFVPADPLSPRGAPSYRRSELPPRKALMSHRYEQRKELRRFHLLGQVPTNAGAR
jgi:hypothetical protein